MSIEILPLAADVIALRIRARLDHDGMERMIDMIERLISEHDKPHFFVEAIDFAGFGFGRLGDYAGWVWPIPGRLGRFGRIAIASDQAWLCAAARLESAPFRTPGRSCRLGWIDARRR